MIKLANIFSKLIDLGRKNKQSIVQETKIIAPTTVTELPNVNTSSTVDKPIAKKSKRKYYANNKKGTNDKKNS